MTVTVKMADQVVQKMADQEVKKMVFQAESWDQ
jgi:hypothetical protein